jgi:hypothetical protein
MLGAMSDTIAADLTRIGIRIPEILLPRHDIDLNRWAVIACDQHTSEPEYWRQVEAHVGDHPSTLHLVYPEAYLDEPDPHRRISRIHETMRSYLETGIVQSIGHTMVLTRRSTRGAAERRGLVLAIDLEQYDYTPGAKSLIRATEQTIVERLPPRVRIREGAPLELPHVLVLIDDPADELFAAFEGRQFETLYETDLMLGGGSIRGYRLDDDAIGHVASVCRRLLERSRDDAPFLFAVGDGNHSLATAKAVWERQKTTASGDHPSRYALVEVTSIYDPGLHFEPIHRLVRCRDPDGFVRRMASDLGSGVERCGEAELSTRLATPRSGRSAAIGYATATECGVIRLPAMDDLPVAAVQSHLDACEGIGIDYIHGWNTSVKLGREPGSLAIVLPDFDARLLYPTVASRGVLPRKAFSLGEAEEKRYYLEARRIS